MLLCITRIAVMTTMMENTPTSTPSSVSAERNLCAASAPMAMKKLSRDFGEQDDDVGFMRFYSFRNASTGFIRAARHAGKNRTAARSQRDQQAQCPRSVGDKVAGMNFCISNVTARRWQAR